MPTRSLFPDATKDAEAGEAVAEAGDAKRRANFGWVARLRLGEGGLQKLEAHFVAICFDSSLQLGHCLQK